MKRRSWFVACIAVLSIAGEFAGGSGLAGDAWTRAFGDSTASTVVLGVLGVALVACLMIWVWPKKGEEHEVGDADE